MLPTTSVKHLLSYQPIYNTHDILFLTKTSELQFLWACI